MVVRIRRISVVTSLIACALLLTACGSTHTVSSESATPPQAKTTTLAAKQVVVSIGDSIMNGYGLSRAEAWPALLAANNNWSLTNLACDGAGFGTVGAADECDSDFSGLVAKATAVNPTLILIAGSSNDLGVDNGTLRAQTDAVIKALRAALPATTILGISTVWNDTDTPGQIDDIDSQVSQAMEQVGGVYLDIGQPFVGHRDWLQNDEVHPTVEGQQELAKVIDAAIQSANLNL